VGEFIDILQRSTLAERRPVRDVGRMGAMLSALICVAAWDGDLIVGMARCVTDFAYCCHVSELAVDVSFQR
jgi:hypothetical protein